MITFKLSKENNPHKPTFVWWIPMWRQTYFLPPPKTPFNTSFHTPKNPLTVSLSSTMILFMKKFKLVYFNDFWTFIQSNDDFHDILQVLFTHIATKWAPIHNCVFYILPQFGPNGRYPFGESFVFFVESFVLFIISVCCHFKWRLEKMIYHGHFLFFCNFCTSKCAHQFSFYQ